MTWQPIETAPKDEVHVRGLWVVSAETGRVLYFDMALGYVDEDGDFVGTGGEDHGWRPDDYEWWAPVPFPFPEPPERTRNETD